MPAPKKVEYDALYAAMWAKAALMGESNDCAVKAVCAASGAPYETVHALMKKHGRRDRRGTAMTITTNALAELGFDVKSVPASYFLSRYPGVHKNIRNVTTHHPDRFPEVWQDGKTYLIRTSGHILAVVNGRNCDWTRGSAKRALWIYEVTRK